MKGMVLCGGKGCRLRPVTLAINKHLLPIYDKPMVTFPLDTLRSLGVTEVMLVCDPLFYQNFRALLGETYLCMKMHYKMQMSPAGTAQAISLGRKFIGDEKFAVILGDNVFGYAPFITLPEFPHAIYVKEVENPKEFGVLDYPDSIDDIPQIVEKPEKPPSNDAVTGLYIYGGDEVFHHMETMKKSVRGEIEVTDLNNHLLRVGFMEIIRVHGPWWDAGTFDAINDISNWRRSGGR